MIYMITHFKLSYTHHNFHIPKVTTKRSHSIHIPFATKLRSPERACDQGLGRQITTVISLWSKGLIFCNLGILVMSNVWKNRLHILKVEFCDLKYETANWQLSECQHTVGMSVRTTVERNMPSLTLKEFTPFETSKLISTPTIKI